MQKIGPALCIEIGSEKTFYKIDPSSDWVVCLETGDGDFLVRVSSCSLSDEEKTNAMRPNQDEPPSPGLAYEKYNTTVLVILDQKKTLRGSEQSLWPEEMTWLDHYWTHAGKDSRTQVGIISSYESQADYYLSMEVDIASLDHMSKVEVEEDRIGGITISHQSSVAPGVMAHYSQFIQSSGHSDYFFLVYYAFGIEEPYWLEEPLHELIEMIEYVPDSYTEVFEEGIFVVSAESFYETHAEALAATLEYPPNSCYSTESPYLEYQEVDTAPLQKAFWEYIGSPSGAEVSDVLIVSGSEDWLFAIEIDDCGEHWCAIDADDLPDNVELIYKKAFHSAWLKEVSQLVSSVDITEMGVDHFGDWNSWDACWANRDDCAEAARLFIEEHYVYEHADLLVPEWEERLASM